MYEKVLNVCEISIVVTKVVVHICTYPKWQSSSQSQVPKARFLSKFDPKVDLVKDLLLTLLEWVLSLWPLGRTLSGADENIGPTRFELRVEPTSQLATVDENVGSAKFILRPSSSLTLIERTKINTIRFDPKVKPTFDPIKSGQKCGSNQVW
jgi:hypothetical protein